MWDNVVNDYEQAGQAAQPVQFVDTLAVLTDSAACENAPARLSALSFDAKKILRRIE